jgi:hypothetical protein
MRSSSFSLYSRPNRVAKSNSEAFVSHSIRVLLSRVTHATIAAARQVANASIAVNCGQRAATCQPVSPSAITPPAAPAAPRRGRAVAADPVPAGHR